MNVDSLMLPVKFREPLIEFSPSERDEATFILVREVILPKINNLAKPVINHAHNGILVAVLKQPFVLKLERISLQSKSLLPFLEPANNFSELVYFVGTLSVLFQKLSYSLLALLGYSLSSL